MCVPATMPLTHCFHALYCQLLSTLVGTTSFNDKLTIAMCGITKIFVGDLVETGECAPHSCLFQSWVS